MTLSYPSPSLCVLFISLFGATFQPHDHYLTSRTTPILVGSGQDPKATHVTSFRGLWSLPSENVFLEGAGSILIAWRCHKATGPK